MISIQEKKRKKKKAKKIIKIRIKRKSLNTKACERDMHSTHACLAAWLC